MTAVRKLSVLDPRIPAWARDELVERGCPLCYAKGHACFERPDTLEVRHCETCDTWFVSPAPSDAALSRFYSDYAATHRKRPDDEVERLIRAQQPGESLVLSELMSSMHLAGKKLLDVGCGKGAFLHLAERVGARGYGVDLDVGSVRFASERLGLAGVHCGTISDLDPNSRFDVIAMLDFVEHPLEVVPTLRRAADLLVPGGVLVIWTPNASEFVRSPEPLALRVDLEHMQYFSFRSVARVADALHLTVIHLEACGEPDLGVTRTREQAGVRALTMHALRGVARRVGLAGLRGRIARPPFAERRGDYCLFALLRKPSVLDAERLPSPPRWLTPGSYAEQPRALNRCGLARTEVSHPDLQAMRTFLAAFVVATLVGALLTPLVRRFALRVGAISRPGGRHIHKLAIPRLGGLAVVGAFFAPLVGLFFVESAVAEAFRSDKARVLGLFAGGVIMCAVGFADDTRGVRALHKLYAQVLVAVLAYACGYRIDAVTLPLFGTVSMGVFALPITIAWIIGIVNAVNLIDGLDGLAAGVVFFACLTNFIVCYIAGAPVVALLMAATMGAVVGFLFYNFNPARIFMGDSGSYFLGFVLAATSLSGGPKASTPVALLVPVLALGVPIFDVMLAMVRRVLERRSIFSPDRGHIHHRLLDMGITHRRAVLIIYGASIVLAGTAITVYMGRSWQIGVALLGASVVLFMLVRMAGYFEYFQARRRQRGSPRTHDVELLRRAVPLLTVALEKASTTTEVLEALDAFCELARLYTCQVLERGTETALHSFTNASDSSRRDELFAKFPLGQAEQRPLDVRFSWPSEYGEVSPQAEVLLQVAADLVETHLGRIRSSLLLTDPFAAGREAAVGDAPAADLPHVHS